MTNCYGLKNLTHLRLRGPDAERYLTGQITQRVDDLPVGQSRYTFVCDAKGRILFDAFVRRDAEGFLLSIEGGEREEQLARLDRYLIADDCAWSDESERWAIRHEIEPSPTGEEIIRFGLAGRDEYVEGAAKEALAETPPADCEQLRIANGRPRLTDLVGAFPAETGLENEAVSFHKGCYLGQEVISRMKRAGRVNRKLVALFLNQAPQSLPAELFAADSDKAQLVVTSVAHETIEVDETPVYPALGSLSSRYQAGTPLSGPEGLALTGFPIEEEAAV
ncbi:YgfZ/GcvT domain-containing protein [Roseibacillus ishigakijimensis]|uniref:Folate-binding protein YgfZ n=1 Tax=Roseibacillus ishigakijimensis TaxID=454146 RepID=A0A934VML6_9BACT|nr:folate-binding protein YgfZ [Roseibacillus ishigakijimensis]MBK1834080.1 folate-binding protein YgfZ [Roseibacillus ishigakijimensis]